MLIAIAESNFHLNVASIGDRVQPLADDVAFRGLDEVEQWSVFQTGRFDADEVGERFVRDEKREVGGNNGGRKWRAANCQPVVARNRRNAKFRSQS